MKLKLLKIRYLTNILLISLIILLPHNLYLAGLNSNVIPAFDVIVIYYLATCTQAGNFTIFVLGLAVDKLLDLPLGVSSFAFISANIILLLLEKVIIIKEPITNIAYFVVYCVYVMSIRYLLIKIFSDNDVYLFDLAFYNLTTILTYPIAKVILMRIYKPDAR